MLYSFCMYVELGFFSACSPGSVYLGPKAFCSSGTGAKSLHRSQVSKNIYLTRLLTMVTLTQGSPVARGVVLARLVVEGPAEVVVVRSRWDTVHVEMRASHLVHGRTLVLVHKPVLQSIRFPISLIAP